MSEAAAPVILAADSGLGGLTVVAEIRKALPQARLAYLCDNAFFPYGTRPDAELLAQAGEGDEVEAAAAELPAASNDADADHDGDAGQRRDTDDSSQSDPEPAP